MDNNFQLCGFISMIARGIVYVFIGVITSGSSSCFATKRDCFVIDAVNLISSLRIDSKFVRRSFSVIFCSMVIKVYSLLLSAVKGKNLAY